MRIKILGSSSGWPIPRIGCQCEQCTSTDEKDKRWRSSMLVDDVLIDAGPDAYHQFMKYGVSKIKALVVTHAHLDHTAGIWDVNPTKLREVKTAPLYSLEKTWKFVKRVFPEARFDEKIIKPEDKFEIDGLKFECFPVVHSLMEPAVGLRIDGKVVYIPDVRMIEKKFEKYLEGVELAILDGSCLEYAFPAWTKSWGHWSMKEACELCKKLKVKRVVFTHIGHRTATHAQLNETLKKYYSHAEAAYDGMEIEI